VSFPSINLKKKGVSVSFMVWNGDIPAYYELEEVWFRVEGIPPKYLSWRVMMRVATSLGIPIDVDWHEIFGSFYRMLRIKVAIRDITKIPVNRLLEFGGRNFMLTLVVVQDPVVDGGNEDGDDPNDNQENDNLEEDMGRDEDLPNDGGKKPMETEQNEKTPRTVTRVNSTNVQDEGLRIGGKATTRDFGIEIGTRCTQVHVPAVEDRYILLAI
jgi:hypothetical protein